MLMAVSIAYLTLLYKRFLWCHFITVHSRGTRPVNISCQTVSTTRNIPMKLSKTFLSEKTEKQKVGKPWRIVSNSLPEQINKQTIRKLTFWQTQVE